MVEPKITTIGLKYKGGNVIQLLYEGGNFTRKEIKEFGNSLSKRLNKDGAIGRIQTEIYYDDIGWRGAPSTKIGKNIRLFTFLDYYDEVEEGKDQKYFGKVKFYIIRGSEGKGGCSDEYNDCLYECLTKVIPRSELPWKTPAEFKKIMG